MKTFGIMLVVALCLLTVPAALAGDLAQLSVTPEVIKIDTFYDGTTLVASGSVPAESQAILRLAGASCDLHLKEKGKVFGIMWMNLDSLVFKGVPSACIVSSAVDLDSLAPKGDQGEGSAIGSLRLAGLEERAGIDPAGSDKESEFKEFLKLKLAEGLYREVAGNVWYGRDSEGRKSFRAEIPVPSRLAPGAYLVELAAVQDGAIVARTQVPVRVDLVGFPAFLSDLALGHSALYGVLATLIAILAGLAIGMVFQSKGAH